MTNEPQMSICVHSMECIGMCELGHMYIRWMNKIHFQMNGSTHLSKVFYRFFMQFLVHNPKKSFSFNFRVLNHKHTNQSSTLYFFNYDHIFLFCISMCIQSLTLNWHYRCWFQPFEALWILFDKEINFISNSWNYSKVLSINIDCVLCDFRDEILVYFK